MVEENIVLSTGRRKKSVARVRLVPGNGEIQVNKKPLDEYFDRPTLKLLIRQPLKTTNLGNKFNIIATVKGGGISGQAGAVRHGISRALSLTSEDTRALLRRKGYFQPRILDRAFSCLRRANVEFSLRNGETRTGGLVESTPVKIGVDILSDEPEVIGITGPGHVQIPGAF